MWGIYYILNKSMNIFKKVQIILQICDLYNGFLRKRKVVWGNYVFL